jgi:hypothetical protein
LEGGGERRWKKDSKYVGMEIGWGKEGVGITFFDNSNQGKKKTLLTKRWRGGCIAFEAKTEEEQEEQ